LFIVDEKANKWAAEDVSETTAGATPNSVAQIVSGNGRLWAPMRSSKLEKNAAFKGGVLIN
jgi:hypothetical protein